MKIIFLIRLYRFEFDRRTLTHQKKKTIFTLMWKNNHKTETKTKIIFITSIISKLSSIYVTHTLQQKQEYNEKSEKNTTIKMSLLSHYVLLPAVQLK